MSGIECCFPKVGEWPPPARDVHPDKDSPLKVNICALGKNQVAVRAKEPDCEKQEK